jgi:hypothetical protein
MTSLLPVHGQCRGTCVCLSYMLYALRFQSYQQSLVHGQCSYKSSRPKSAISQHCFVPKYETALTAAGGQTTHSQERALLFSTTVKPVENAAHSSSGWSRFRVTCMLRRPNKKLAIAHKLSILLNIYLRNQVTQQHVLRTSSGDSSFEIFGCRLQISSCFDVIWSGSTSFSVDRILQGLSFFVTACARWCRDLGAAATCGRAAILTMDPAQGRLCPREPGLTNTSQGGYILRLSVVND